MADRMPESASAPLLVVAAALLSRDGLVLVQRRRDGGHHGGLWEFPGGKIEPGETPEAALARELAEELAIAVDSAAMTPIAFATQPGERPLILLLYLVAAWQGVPAATVADALAWHRPADLAALPMPPADRPLVAMLMAALKARACQTQLL